MAYQVIYKKRFYNKLTALLNYLEAEWNKEVAKQFLQKLDKRLATLKMQPYIGSPSQSIKDVRGILITKHNKLFYKVTKNTIIVLTMYDTRIDPKKNRYL
jgi:plasmid stabilization system protein ParE